MRPEEIIRVIEAFQEGKEIYSRLKKESSSGKPGPWTKAITPSWNFPQLEYRVYEEIKPFEAWVNMYENTTIFHHSKEAAIEKVGRNVLRVAVHLKEVVEEEV